MNIDTITQKVQVFFQQYTLLAVIVVLALLICLFRNPKEFLKCAAALVVLGTALYFLMLFSGTLSTGVDQKDRVIHKTREALGD